jgi:tetratricopeptide (TPR) repeat protein
MKLEKKQVLPGRNMTETLDAVQHIADYIEHAGDEEFTKNLKKAVNKVDIEFSKPNITSSTNAIGLLTSADYKFSEAEKKVFSNSESIKITAQLTLQLWKKAKADVIMNDHLSWQTQRSSIGEVDFANYDFVESQLSRLRKFLAEIETEKLSQDPNRFQIPARNENFVGREEELAKIKKLLLEKRPVCITGSGGVGKSQLASEYLLRANYSKILWLYAEHGLLYSQIQMYMQKIYGTDPSMKQEELLPIFYNNLGDDACIIIDNAEDGELIAPFLPKNQVLDILITSRYKSWEFPIVNLNSFSANDTHVYITKAFGTCIEIVEKDSAELHKLVDGLPLAVVQAAAYINQQEKMSLSDYCETFVKNQEQVLRDGDPVLSTVATTFTIALHDIRKKDPFVDGVMNVLGYISPDHITLEILQDYYMEVLYRYLCSKNKQLLKINRANLRNELQIFDDLNKTLEILKFYSLLSIDGNHLKMHRLTQSVIRMVHRSIRIFDRNYEQAAEWLMSQLGYDRKDLKEVARISSLVPHGLAICEIEHVIEKYWKEIFSIYYGISAYQLDNFQQSFFSCTRALEIAEKKFGLDHLVTAEALNNLGRAYQELGKYERAIELKERGLAIKEKKLNENSIELGVSLGDLGGVYMALGNYEKAKDLLERALVIADSHGHDENDDTASILHNLGLLYGNLGYQGKKIKLLERALKIKKKCFGEEHPETASTLEGLGVAYEHLGNSKKAEELLEYALNLYEKNYGKNHLASSQTLMNLGVTYVSLGKYEKAKELLESSLVLKSKQYGEDHPETALALDNLGRLYSCLGDYGKAKELTERALIIFEKKYEKSHRKLVPALFNLGTICLFLNEFEKSIELLERSLNIIKKHLGSDHTSIAEILINLGKAYAQLGDIEKSTDYNLSACIVLLKSPSFGINHPLTQVAYKNYKYFNAIMAKVNFMNIFGGQDPFGLGISEENNFDDSGDDYTTNFIIILLLKQDGKNLMESQQYEKALRCFDAIISLDSSNFDGYFNKAICCQELGKYADAIDANFKALEIDPNSLEVKNNLGFIGNQEKLRICDPNTVITSNRFVNMYKLIDNYIDLDAFEKARELLENFLIITEQTFEEEDKMVHILEKLGNIYQDRGNYAQMKVMLERSLAIKEKHFGSDNIETAKTLRNLSNAYKFSGDLKKALEFSENAYNIFLKYPSFGPNHPHTKMALEAYLGIKHTLNKNPKNEEKPIRNKKRLFEDSDEDANASLIEASYKDSNNSLVEKETILQKGLLDDSDEDNDLHFWAIEAFYKPSNSLEREFAEPISNNFGTLNESLAESKKQKEKLIADIDYFDKKIESDPTNAIFWFEKGLILKNLNKYDEAMGCYKIALEFRPNYLEVQSAMEELWIKKSSEEKSLQKKSDKYFKEVEKHEKEEKGEGHLEVSEKNKKPHILVPIKDSILKPNHEQSQGSTGIGCSSKECTIYTLSTIIYDNPLLNLPYGLKKAAKFMEVRESQALSITSQDLEFAKYLATILR